MATPVSALDMKFTLDGQHTRMFIQTQEPPWRAIRAFRNSQSQAVVHLHNVSGGILAGDALNLSIVAGIDTRVQVTSVGATRIYRHLPLRSTASLFTSIRVEDGAMLEYLPDPFIPFAGSRFRQTTAISLGASAGFIGWETIAAGRIASGEVFAFDAFDSQLSLSSVARPLALESYSLAPEMRDPRSIARWGRFHYSSTLYVCHTGIAQSRWLDLESRLNDLAFGQTTTASRWGVSTLVAGGLVVRGLTLEAHQSTSALFRFWDFARKDIWGEPAVPPRKIN